MNIIPEEEETRYDQFFQNLKQTHLLELDGNKNKYYLSTMLNQIAFNEEAELIRSKRSLQVILRYEEMSFNQSYETEKKNQVSELVLELIFYKIEFNQKHWQQIHASFRKAMGIHYLRFDKLVAKKKELNDKMADVEVMDQVD